MSEGHVHWHVTVRENSPFVRLLRSATVWRTHDAWKAKHSRYVYTPEGERATFRMSLLGWLHGLTGLTLEVEE